MNRRYWLLLWALFSITPITPAQALCPPLLPVADETIDVIEVNHFYDDSGKHVFDQIIFWEYRRADGAVTTHDCALGRVVQACRFIKCYSQMPQRDYGRGCTTTIWHDGDTLRRVRAACWFETWTQFDPEVANRSVLAQCDRRELLGMLPSR